MKKIIFALMIALLCVGCSYKHRVSKPRHINQYYKEQKTGYQYVQMQRPVRVNDPLERENRKRCGKMERNRRKFERQRKQFNK